MKNVYYSFIVLIISVLSVMNLSAQNIQLHYDLGHTMSNELSTRPSVTTTIEMFRADKVGNTFFFADIDYFTDGVAGAYWEVSREFNLGKSSPFAVHFEYDGGLSSNQITHYSTRFQHAALLGGAWNWHNTNFSRTFSLQAMYKQYFKGQHSWNKAFASFQTTAVWGMQLAKGLVSFSGFADLWYNPDVNGRLVFLAEPQLWLNINRFSGCWNINLSLGTEVEISNNFVWTAQGQNNRLFVIPTLAAKWTF